MALQHFIESGKGFVGVHAATDTEYGWPWYGKMVGAYFLKHPKQQQATLHVVDSTDIATRHLPTTWSRFDEWYNFRDIQPDLHVLITIDERTYNNNSELNRRLSSYGLEARLMRRGASERSIPSWDIPKPPGRTHST